MNDDVIARARAVLSEASPGPWEARGRAVVDEERHVASTGVRDRGGEENARAIVLAVNALPALLELLEAAQRIPRPYLCASATCDCEVCAAEHAMHAALTALRKEVERG